MKKKIFAIITAIAALVAVPCVVAACGGHEHSYTDKVIAPTCTEKGYTLHECECGESYKDNEVSAKGHDYVNFVCGKCGDEGGDIPDTEGLEFSLSYNGKSYSVSGVGTAEGEILKIPATYNGLPVTGTSWWGDYGFYDFKSVFVPESITSLRSAFDNFGNLENITVSSANKYFGSVNGILYNKDKTEIVRVPRNRSGNFEIPFGITTIGYGAFRSCNSLTSVTIPTTVTTIGEQAFWYCAGLINLIIPDSVKTMGPWAFRDCSGLESVTIGKGLTEISVCAFDGCTNLTRVTIPNGIITIGAFAFKGCEKLTEITIPESVTTIEYEVLSGCPCLERIIVSDKNKNYCSVNGVLYSKDKTELIRVPQTVSGKFVVPNGVKVIGRAALYGCSLLTDVDLPEGLNSIDRNAFYECNGLTEITLPESLTEIGDYAFNSCMGLASLIIPESVKTIGRYAFARCSGLTSITLPKGLTEISENMFAMCPNLTDIKIPDSVKTIGEYAFAGCWGLTDITIPEGVTFISYNAFMSCRELTGITIPKSITTIERSAFSGCRNLADIYFDGTLEEWDAVEKEDGWIYNSYDYTIHCTNGDLING